MILKTKIEITRDDVLKLTGVEKEKYEAKREVLGDAFEEDESLYGVVEKVDVVIDTINNLIYVDNGDGTITMKPLLSPDLVTSEDGQAMYLYPTVVFDGTIDQIFKELKKDNKI